MEPPIKKRRKRLPLWTKGGALQVLAALLWVPQAWVLAEAIGAMATGQVIWETVVWSAVWTLLIGIARNVLDTWGARISFLAARKQLSVLRGKAIESLSVRSPMDILRPTSGAAASILAEQAETIVPYLSRYQPVQLKVMFVPIVIFSAVFSQSWLAALVLLCAAPFIPVFMVLIGFGAQKASKKQMLEIWQMNSFLLDRLRGLTTIRVFGAVDMIAVRLRQAADQVQRKTMSVLRLAFLSSAVLELFSALGVAMVAVYIGFHLLGQLNWGAWGDRLSLAQGMFILLLAPNFFEPLRELSAVWHDRAAGAAAMEGMDKLSEQGVELVGQKRSEQVKDLVDRGADQGISVAMSGALSVDLQQVSFRYPGSYQAVLKNFNLQINPGEKVALVAPSGQGKSTILSLIAGLLHANEGRIDIGGVELNNATADVLRMHMGWISQQPHVFAGTLLHNITLGRQEISPQKVQNAVDAAALTQIAQGQLERRLGEGGTGLSGGEVLRLALARALVTPDLGLLLADEPTAHLDSQTAQEVVDGLMTLSAQGVTLVVATHDERVLPYMDKVIRLEDWQTECECTTEYKETDHG